jgi:sugar phosphate isomerase/epimerase
VQVDYAKMFDALRDVGYDDYWVFEVGWEQAQTNIQGWRYLEGKYG